MKHSLFYSVIFRLNERDKSVLQSLKKPNLTVYDDIV